MDGLSIKIHGGRKRADSCSVFPVLPAGTAALSLCKRTNGVPRARAASQYGSWGHNKVRKHSLPSFVPSQRPASVVLHPRVNPIDGQPPHTSFPLRGRYPGEKTDVASEGHYAIHLYYQPSLRSIDKLFILCSTDTMLIRFPDCNRIPETAELERGRLILAHTFEGRRAPLVSPVSAVHHGGGCG